MLKHRHYLLIVALLLVGAFAAGCGQQVSTKPQSSAVPDGEKDPAVWGKVYPLQYKSFMRNNEGGQGQSKYKGSDPTDKLSQYPYQLVLYDGWGFGVEFNEPRGHTYMLKDQLDIDASRRKSGGVCLTCKTPYASDLKNQMGVSYYKDQYDGVHAKIPSKHAELGLSCIDCHDTKTAELKISRWMLTDALKVMGKDADKLTRQEKRSIMCAQCHVTYSVKKDKDMKSVGLYFPWGKSKWGNISIENIEAEIKSDPANYEWKSNVTGMKLGHIRHPEFELFSNGSTRWEAGVACADCHMPYKRDGKTKYSSHHVQSPLKDGMKPCMKCHNQDEDWLRNRVIYIQDRTNNLMTRAGNATAQAAKAIEMANKTPNIDQKILNKAKELYETAYYRVGFIAAENSMGFHNPEEAEHVLGDGLYYAQQSEMKAREALLKAGVNPPEKFDLELSKYNKRGAKGLPYKPELNKEFTFDGVK